MIKNTIKEGENMDILNEIKSRPSVRVYMENSCRIYRSWILMVGYAEKVLPAAEKKGDRVIRVE